MASEVDIANQALSHIGADAIVSDLDPPDGSVEAGYCARFLPIARRAAIEVGNWNFAKKRVALAEVTNESNVWQYAYAKPADCIKPLRVLTTQVFSAAGLDINGFNFVDQIQLLDILFNEQGSSSFETEGDVIFTHEPVAVLVYLRDITDVNKFTPLFLSSLGFMLASYLAGPIIKGTEGAKTALSLYDMASKQAERASMADANASSQVHAVAAPWMRARR